jgi:hypothetical protein
MDTAKFSYGKRAIFRCGKESKGLRGGIHRYAAPFGRNAELDTSCCPKGEGQGWPESQANLKIDPATAEKSCFKMENYSARPMPNTAQNLSI